MSFELPTRQGRSKRPVPAISIGARKRGKAGKLTAYIQFTEEAATMLFGADCEALELTVGTGDDAGWVQLTRPAEGQGGNIRLRRQPNVTSDSFAETVLIPYKGDSPLRRKEAEVRFTPDKKLQIKLPWLDKPNRRAQKGL